MCVPEQGTTKNCSGSHFSRLDPGDRLCYSGSKAGLKLTKRSIYDPHKTQSGSQKGFTLLLIQSRLHLCDRSSYPGSDFEIENTSVNRGINAPSLVVLRRGLPEGRHSSHSYGRLPSLPAAAAAGSNLLRHSAAAACNVSSRCSSSWLLSLKAATTKQQQPVT